MVRVEFLGPINMEPISVKAQNLAQLKDILHTKEELSRWLDVSAIAINDEIVTDLNYELRDGDLICILPPVCGG